MKIDKAKVTQRITLNKKDIGLILQQAATFMATDSKIEQKILDVKCELLTTKTSYETVTVVLTVED